MLEKYTNLTKEEFKAITERYLEFQSRLNEVDKEPATVFSPLSAKTVKELELIREVSKELQKKKEEDMKKAAAQASTQEEEKGEGEESNTEDEKKED